MAQHKWHKEIKAWADGAEIQIGHPRMTKDSEAFDWIDLEENSIFRFDNKDYEFRIKPQPKEPDFDATKYQKALKESGKKFKEKIEQAFAEILDKEVSKLAQPKEPTKFLGFKEIPYKHWVLRFYKMPNDLWYTEGINDEWMNEMVEASKPQPKEPQYLYVYDCEEFGIVIRDKPIGDLGETYKGKIPLITETKETDDGN